MRNAINSFLYLRHKPDIDQKKSSSSCSSHTIGSVRNARATAHLHSTVELAEDDGVAERVCAAVAREQRNGNVVPPALHKPLGNGSSNLLWHMRERYLRQWTNRDALFW